MEVRNITNRKDAKTAKEQQTIFVSISALGVLGVFAVATLPALANRYNSSQGEEWLAARPAGEKVDQALKPAPPGVRLRKCK